MTNATQPAASGRVLLERRDGRVLTLTLNRPERLNALNVELGCALRDALRRAAVDSEVRAVVLTGAGRAFCAGGDLKLLQDARARNGVPELESLVRSGLEIVLAIADMPQPVLASVNGPAAGGGMNLALAADVRIGSDDATFIEAFAKLGLAPDFGGLWLLPRLVGPARAAELFWTADTVTADRALALGLVNHVVPAARLAEETQALAAKLAAAPPLAVRAVKRVLFAGDRDALVRSLEEEVRIQVKCFSSEDCAEGLTAFSQKRQPRFRGV